MIDDKSGNKERLTFKRLVLIILTLLLITAAFVKLTPNASGNKYGVFLSETKDLSRLGDYKTVVIDAQYFSKEEIDAFKSEGHSLLQPGQGSGKKREMFDVIVCAGILIGLPVFFILMVQSGLIPQTQLSRVCSESGASGCARDAAHP